MQDCPPDSFLPPPPHASHVDAEQRLQALSVCSPPPAATIPECPKTAAFTRLAHRLAVLPPGPGRPGGSTGGSTGGEPLGSRLLELHLLTHRNCLVGAGRGGGEG